MTIKQAIEHLQKELDSIYEERKQDGSQIDEDLAQALWMGIQALPFQWSMWDIEWGERKGACNEVCCVWHACHYKHIGEFDNGCFKFADDVDITKCKPTTYVEAKKEGLL